MPPNSHQPLSSVAVLLKAAGADMRQLTGGSRNPAIGSGAVIHGTGRVGTSIGPRPTRRESRVPRVEFNPRALRRCAAIRNVEPTGTPALSARGRAPA